MKSLEGPKIKHFRDFERDWKFRARMKFSIEPPTAALFFVGKSRRRDWTFSSLKIKKFDRDWKFRSILNFFSIVGPSGSIAAGPLSQRCFAVKVWDSWGCVNREVQTVNWEAGKDRGLSRQVSRVKGWQTCTFRTCTLFFVTSPHCLTFLGARDRLLEVT